MTKIEKSICRKLCVSKDGKQLAREQTGTDGVQGLHVNGQGPGLANLARMGEGASKVIFEGGRALKNESGGLPSLAKVPFTLQNLLTCNIFRCRLQSR